jgi:hypothetical protein
MDEVAIAGRKVVRIVDVSSEPAAAKRFKAASARLSKTCACKPKVHGPLYHTTTVANGKAIVKEGFKVFRDGKHGHAFGIGVNLSPDFKHTLIYGGNTACTLVCEAVIGRSHDNASIEVPGQSNTVAQYERPRPGYDAMTGFNGMFVVIPSPARVRVLRMIVHKK